MFTVTPLELIQKMRLLSSPLIVRFSAPGPDMVRVSVIMIWPEVRVMVSG